MNRNKTTIERIREAARAAAKVVTVIMASEVTRTTVESEVRTRLQGGQDHDAVVKYLMNERGYGLHDARWHVEAIAGSEPISPGEELWR